MKPRILEIRKNILEDNDKLAAGLRKQFKENSVYVINVVSSPGSGKTELLTNLCKILISKNSKVGVIVGDLETDNDAERLQKSGAIAYQINTNGNCHLESRMIEKALGNITWKNLDMLFIENVGNLVCPASYDLGENLRIVLMSVTEGEDKPLKYPTMFNSADICVISKNDLAQAVEFKKKIAEKNIKSVNPKIQILYTSAKKLDGLENVATDLLSKGLNKHK